MKDAHPRFYILLTRLGVQGCDAYTADGAHIGEPPRCEACGDPIGMREWLPPLQLELRVCRRGYCDLLFPTGNDIVVSARFKEIYEREGLMGLSGFDPVEIVKIKPRRRATEPPPAYFRAHVMRSRAAVDPVASGFDPNPYLPLCPECRLPREGRNWRRRWKGIVIDKTLWFGEDIFYPRGGTGNVVASERFKQVCELHRVSNALFVPAEEYADDFYPHETKDWDIRIYDETLKVLQDMNRAGELNASIEAMEQVRQYVVEDPKFNWIEELRARVCGEIDPIGDAAHEAQNNLVRPWYGKYVRRRKSRDTND